MNRSLERAPCVKVILFYTNLLENQNVATAWLSLKMFIGVIVVLDLIIIFLYDLLLLRMNRQSWRSKWVKICLFLITSNAWLAAFKVISKDTDICYCRWIKEYVMFLIFWCKTCRFCALLPGIHVSI